MATKTQNQIMPVSASNLSGQSTAVRNFEGLVFNPTPQMTMTKWRGELYGDLSWGSVDSIMRGAETIGATDVWAKLTRRMYTDPIILAVRENRLGPICGAKINTSPGGPRDIDKLAAEDVYKMLNSIPNLPAILDHLLDAIMVGYAVGRIDWAVRGEWIWPTNIELISPDRIRFDEHFEPYLYDNGYLMDDPDVDPTIRRMGKPLTANEYIVHLPRTIPDYPVASGLLRSCIRPWWLKWEAMKYWLNGAETAGNARSIGKYPVETPPEARQALYDALESMSATSIIALSKDCDIEIVAPIAEGAGSIWETLISKADQSMTIAVLGSELLTNAGINGSRALGEAQGEYTIDPRLVKDSSALWTTITQQLVKPFLEFNSFRYNYSTPALPNVMSIFVESTTNISTDLIMAGAVTFNELRVARGLPKWPDEIGNKIINTELIKAEAQKAAEPTQDTQAIEKGTNPNGQ